MCKFQCEHGAVNARMGGKTASCGEFQTQQKAKDITRRVRVLTLNALCSPVPNNYEEAGRLQALVDHIKSEQYDVVCLQEFMRHTCAFGLTDGDHVKTYKKFCNSMQALGYADQVMGPPVDGGALFDGGIAIFSKHAFTNVEMIPWVEATSWDAWAAKGIVYARIEVPAPQIHAGGGELHTVPLHVFTLHAQAGHVGWMDIEGSDEYTRVRLRQMKQLGEVVASRAEGEAVLALGDFNFHAGNAKEVFMHQQVLKSTKHPSEPIDVLFQSYGSYPATIADVNEEGKPIETFLTLPCTRGTPECLDHVYFWSSAVRALQCPREGSINALGCAVQPLKTFTTSRPFSHISDHYGVSVELAVNWESPESSAGCDTCCTRSHEPRLRVQNPMGVGARAQPSQTPRRKVLAVQFMRVMCLLCGVPTKVMSHLGHKAFQWLSESTMRMGVFLAITSKRFGPSICM